MSVNSEVKQAGQGFLGYMGGIMDTSVYRGFHTHIFLEH